MSEIESVKYSSYTPAQKKASQLYRQKNKEKINEQRKRYYQKRKETDPNFLEYKRMKAKEYYEKKKLDKVVKTEAKPEVKEELKPEVVIKEEEKPQPEIIEVVELALIPEAEPTKKKKTKKDKKQ